MKYKETTIYTRLGCYYRYVGNTWGKNEYKTIPSYSQTAFFRLLESKPPLIYRFLSKYVDCKDIPIEKQKFQDCRGNTATQELYKAELKYVGVARVKRRPDF